MSETNNSTNYDELVKKVKALRLPEHVGIIMDGNRRWGRERGKNANESHAAGARALEEILRTARDIGIKCVTVYLWSLKNHENRSKIERDFIFKLLLDFYKKMEKEVHENKVRVRFLGRWEELGIADDLRRIERETAHYENHYLNFCFMYDGHAEIVDAVKKIIEKGVRADEVTPELLRANMYCANLPLMDYIIRTGMNDGMRLSGFMLWDSSYAEFKFHHTYFPAYTREMFLQDLIEFSQRKRRFGK